MKKSCWIIILVLSVFVLTSCIKQGKTVTVLEPNDNITEIGADIKTETNEKNQEQENVVEKMQQEEPLPTQESKTEEDIEDVLVIEEEKEEQIEKQIDLETTNKTLIATGETNFNPNQIERSTNIRLAASYINGLILHPGEEFSFNKVVGKRTKERGFLPADIFMGKSVSKGYGGGVCQTSSTVCIVVRQTSIKILEQNPHSQRVTYTTIDNEAMINYGTSDFRFLNTYNKPILIEISFAKSGDREIIKCDIYLLE